VAFSMIENVPKPRSGHMPTTWAKVRQAMLRGMAPPR